MFKITIEETRLVKTVTGKDWKVIGTKEVEREMHLRVKGAEQPTRTDDVYGYTPEIEKQVYQTTTVLTQQVETLDLAKVIKAINNL